MKTALIAIQLMNSAIEQTTTAKELIEVAEAFICNIVGECVKDDVDAVVVADDIATRIHERIVVNIRCRRNNPDKDPEKLVTDIFKEIDKYKQELDQKKINNKPWLQ